MAARALTTLHQHTRLTRESASHYATANREAASHRNAKTDRTANGHATSDISADRDTGTNGHAPANDCTDACADISTNESCARQNGLSHATADNQACYQAPATRDCTEVSCAEAICAA